MHIFLHTADGIALHDVDPAITINNLARIAGVDDAVGWLEDSDEPVNADAAVGKTVGDSGHLHLTRCKRINVTITYAGRTVTDLFTPGTTIGRVRRFAVGKDGFDLPRAEQPKHELGVCGTGVLADHNEHIGTLAEECALCLDLAPKDRFQG